MKIGILGGGQLARMIIEETGKFGFSYRILSDVEDSPAGQLCSEQVTGKFSDYEALKKFAAGCDIVTLENEFIGREYGKYIEDLSDEEGVQLVQGISSAIQDPQFDTAEADGYKLLVVASGDGTQLHYISLLGGWLCDVAALRTDGALADEDVKTAAALLLSVQFDGDAEAESEG